MRRGNQRGRQGQIGHDQHDCGTFESWYGHYNRSDWFIRVQSHAPFPRSPLTGYEPKSLIEVSSEHTRIDLPSRKGSLDTNLDDVATIVDVSQVHDITDVGRLTSPLFSQEQLVSAIPFLFSDVFKRGETHAGR